jgi:hypothetical protein
LRSLKPLRGKEVNVTQEEGRRGEKKGEEGRRG